MLAESLEKRGELSQNEGRFHDAHRLYLAAYQTYRRAQDRFGAAQMLLKCGDTSRQLENFTAALSFYRQARILEKKLAASATGGVVLDAACGEALALRGQGHYREALAQLWRCGRVYRKAGDHEGRAYVLWAMGTTLRFWGRLHEAEKRLRQSLRWYQRFPDPIAQAYALCGLGGTLRMRGFAAESGRLYRQAGAIFRRSRDNFGLAYAACGQGSAERMRNRHHPALKFMTQAARLYGSLRQKGPLAFVLWGRAQSEVALGRWREAKNDLTNAERLFQSVRDRRGLVYIDLGWGEFYGTQNPARAKRFFERAYHAARRLGIRLEQGHARRRFSPRQAQRFYRSAGVDQRRFSSYRSFP